MFSALTREVSDEIEKVLATLLEQVEAEAVFLCDRGGNIIARQSSSSYAHEENIAALASGSFFATLEMARLVGESEFRYVLHQGEKSSIYMEATSAEMLLVVVFSKDSNPGLVKLYARNACQQLAHFNIAVLPGQTVPSMEFEMDTTAQPFGDPDPAKA